MYPAKGVFHLKNYTCLGTRYKTVTSGARFPCQRGTSVASRHAQTRKGAASRPQSNVSFAQYQSTRRRCHDAPAWKYPFPDPRPARSAYFEGGSVAGGTAPRFEECNSDRRCSFHEGHLVCQSIRFCHLSQGPLPLLH